MCCLDVLCGVLKEELIFKLWDGKDDEQYKPNGNRVDVDKRLE